MDKKIGLINQGINFEEQLTAVIAADIIKADSFNSLSDEDKKSITDKLKTLHQDTQRHKKTLEAIAAKY
jgi:hypothetical protein